MRLPRGIRRLLRLDFGRGGARRDLDDELDFHFEEVVRDLVAQGHTENEARTRARLRFGDERAYRSTLERIDTGRVRMRERSEFLDAFLRTIGTAVRGVRRAPGFGVAVIVILALGIGANAVMFGVVDRLLLSPPQHVRDADAVRLLHIQREIFNGEIRASRTITWPDYQDFRQVGAFADVAAYTETQRMTVGRGEAASQARIAFASANLFPLLGVAPAVGRFYGADDDALDANPTAVLAYEYWEREYGRDPDLIGTTIDVAHGRYTVVGVAPPGFTGAELLPVDIWLPILVAQSIENGADNWADNRGWYWVKAVARLAQGASVEAAAAEATAAHRGGRAEMIEQDRYDGGAEVLVAPIIAAQGPSPTSEAQVARWLAGVSLIVLLIACFNVANLMLARSMRARREIAVRLALGVSRKRLMAEMVTESLVLAAAGAIAALLVARGLGGFVHQALLPNVAFTDTALGTRLLGFTLVLTLVAGLLAGIVPALQSATTELADALRAGSRGVAGHRSKVRVSLLVGQAALSVVLLVGAGLFVRSLRSARETDLGFDARNVVVVTLEWNESLDGAERRAIYRRALQGIRRLPGVTSAGLSYTVNFRSSISLGQPRIPGRDSIPRHQSGGPYANKVGSGYFEAMGLSILQGRDFAPSDDVDDAPPVAIVSESMARAIWPDGDALGACMMLGREEDSVCTEVVGIVENHRRQELVEDDPHFLYFVNEAHPDFLGPPQALMVGTTEEAEGVVDLVRAEAAAASPQIRFVEADALSDYVEPQLRSWTLGASMFSAFGLLALIVAGWGLYSVLAFDVALRHQELGIRSALGADVGRLVRLVLRQALSLVIAGVGIGLVASYAAAGFVEPLLFRVSATDPPVYVTVTLALLVVAAIAGSLPAWRATRVDPREALQAD